MIKKIKEYVEYRRNKKIAKRTAVKVMATLLPTINTIATRGTDIVQFIVGLVNEAKSTENEKLIEMALSKIAETLKTEDSRIVEALSYMVTLQPEEFQKILVHSMVETNPEINKN